MTNKQAKSEIMQIYDMLSPNKQQALDMAIKALEQESKTGHWIEDRFGNKCSCCGIHINKYINFLHCPVCGAKMIEPQESEDEE